MATVIDDPETDRLVKRYAEAHGTSPAEAVHRAISEAIEREGIEQTSVDLRTREEIAADFIARVRRIQERVRQLPVLDPRHPDEILYDEDGLPK
jgi:antitoxin VapB